MCREGTLLCRQWWAAAQNGRFTMHARQLESDKPLSQSYQRDISFIKSARGKLYDEKIRNGPVYLKAPLDSERSEKF